MEFEFTEKLIYWKGPAPWYFLRMPEKEVEMLNTVANEITYGWGCRPVQVTIGKTTWETSLIPKDGSYLVPIKAAIRKAENIGEEGEVTVSLSFSV